MSASPPDPTTPKGDSLDRLEAGLGYLLDAVANRLKNSIGKEAGRSATDLKDLAATLRDVAALRREVRSQRAEELAAMPDGDLDARLAAIVAKRALAAPAPRLTAVPFVAQSTESTQPPGDTAHAGSDREPPRKLTG